MVGVPSSGSARVRLSISPDTQSVSPGQTATFVLVLENVADDAQTPSLELTGLPDSWYRILFAQSDREIRPRESLTATLVVTVPEEAPEREHQLHISALTPGSESAATVSIAVSRSADLAVAAAQPAPVDQPRAPSVSLTPGLVLWHGRDQAPERLTVRIRNPGPVDADYEIELDGLERSWFSLPGLVHVTAGDELQTEATIQPPPSARQQDYPFQVLVSLAGQPEVRAEAAGWLSLRPSTATQTQEPGTSGAPARSATRPASSESRVVPPDVVLSPGSNFRFGPTQPVAQAIITVYNRGQLSERFEMSVVGIPDDWYTLSAEELRLEPGRNAQVSLRLNPVTGPAHPAGEYEFLVRARPQSSPDYYGEALGAMSIAGVARFDARIQPLQAQGRAKTFDLVVANTGDLPIKMSLDAAEAENKCKFRLPSPRDILPGQEGHIPIKVGARRLGIIGPPETFDFEVRLKPETSSIVAGQDTFTARFIHRPLLSNRSVFLAAFLCALVACVVLIVWLVSAPFADAATWVGCQFDSNYRFSTNSPLFKKQECGGKPWDQQFENWQAEQKKRSITRELPSGSSHRFAAQLVFDPASRRFV